VHSSFVRQTGTRGRLIESRYQRFLSQKIAIAPTASNRFQFIGYFKYMKELVPFEFLE
jgi:hypothetical protein